MIRNASVMMHVLGSDNLLHIISYPSSFTGQSLSISTTNRDTTTTSNGVTSRQMAIPGYNFSLTASSGYSVGNIIINGVNQGSSSVSNFTVDEDIYITATAATQLYYPTMTLTATDSTPSNNHTVSVSGTLPSDATGTVTIYLATTPNASNYWELTNPKTVSIVNGQFSCTYTTSRAYYVVAIYDGDSKYEGARAETTSMAYVNYAFTIGVDTTTVDLSDWGSVTAAWGLYGVGASGEYEVTYGTETLDENNYVYQNSGILVPTHEIRPNRGLLEISYYVRLDTDELDGLTVDYDDENHVTIIYSDTIDDLETPL